MKRLTKINSFVLALIILCCSFLGDTNIFTSAETVRIGVINHTDVRIRSDASANSSILDKVSNINTTVVGQKQGTDNSYLWYQVTYTSPGSDYASAGTVIMGYVREDLITVTTYSTSVDFEESLKAFPESYHPYLRALHAVYPNWKFVADEISLTFDEAVALEGQDRRKQVYYTDGLSWRSMGSGAYDWGSGTYVSDNGNWYGASREVIAYYMDPRNFLNDTGIYMFLKQGYDSTVDYTEGVNKIISGTFLANGYSDPNDTAYGGSYTKVIIEAGRQSGVSPYVLASTIRQEQGVNGSSLSNGVTYNEVTVYNFFNWNASGSTTADVINNGAAYAYDMGWTTRSASIIEGAVKYGDGYVSAGQDTYFYKNYNIINPDKIWKQYAQNVVDSYSSAKNLKPIYSEQYDWELFFRIPVYKNNSLPSTVSGYPDKNSNENNYYFNTIEVSGLSPSFSRYNYEYALQVSGNTSIYVEMPSTASLATPATYNLSAGENKITLSVKAQTGYTNDYVIYVNSATACTLTITTEKGTTPPDTPTTPTPTPTPTVLRGDTNGDGKISLSDLSNVRLHLVGSITLTGDSFTGADTNGDGKISLSDLSNIRLHLVGSINLN